MVLLLHKVPAPRFEPEHPR